MSLFSKLIVLTNLEDLTNILMCFFLGKFISKIHEYSEKSEKFEIDLVWKLKHIILEIFWPELLKLINSY